MKNIEIFKDCFLKKCKSFEDDRGVIFEKFNLKNKKDEIFSFSKRFVFRGFHGDNKTKKVIHFLDGSARFFLINLNEFKNEYKKYEIDLFMGQYLIIPKNVLIGFYCFQDSLINYQLSTNYKDQKQYSISYEGIINLPNNVIISNRDKNAKKINLNNILKLIHYD